MLERALEIAVEFADSLLEVRTRNVMGIVQGDLGWFRRGRISVRDRAHVD